MCAVEEASPRKQRRELGDGSDSNHPKLHRRGRA
jgi:hypothetical protein